MARKTTVIWLLCLIFVCCSCGENKYNANQQDILYELTDVENNYMSPEGKNSATIVTERIFQTVGIINNIEDAGNVGGAVIKAVLGDAPSDILRIKYIEENGEWSVIDKKNDVAVTLNQADAKISVLYNGKPYGDIIKNYKDGSTIAYYILKAIYKERITKASMNLNVLSETEWFFENETMSKDADGGNVYVSLSIPDGNIITVWGEQ